MNAGHVSLLAVTIPLAAVVGLFVGSFLNVVIYRVPRRLSVISPRSSCPTCHRQLEWWENVPLVSWLGLRGRCHGCHQPISPRYPGVELSTGIAFSLVTWGWHGGIPSAGYCALAAAMIAVALIEYGGRRAPLVVAAVGTAIGQLVLVIGAGWQHHWRIAFGSLAGTAAAFVVIAVLRSVDPDCVDPRGHGRTALLVAGCWVGGLGPHPAAIGAGTWIVVYLVCMVATWSFARNRVAVGAGGPATPGVPTLASTPLVTAIAVALVASLVAYR